MNLRSENPNLAQLQFAAARLEPLLDRIVFVGGCVTGLLLTDPGAAPIRSTMDVDGIIDIASYVDFTLFEDQLRRLGCRESHVEGSPICRWLADGLILDLMPIDKSILGFSNRWYKPAFKNSQVVVIGDFEIKILTAPYFLATKLEAFHGRGRNDFSSHDLEDVISIIDGRSEICAEVRLSQPDLRKYLSDEFKLLVASRDFIKALPGHLMPDPASQQRLGLIVSRMRDLIIES